MSNTPSASFLPITHGQRTLGNALASAVIIEVSRAMLQRKDPEPTLESLTELFASLMAAAKLDESLLTVIVGRYAMKQLTEKDPKGVISLDKIVSQDDIRHMLTLKDDRQAVGLFLKTRPKVMSAIKEHMDEDTTFDQIVDCIITGIQQIKLPDVGGQ